MKTRHKSIITFLIVGTLLFAAHQIDRNITHRKQQKYEASPAQHKSELSPNSNKPQYQSEPFGAREYIRILR